MKLLLAIILAALLASALVGCQTAPDGTRKADPDAIARIGAFIGKAIWLSANPDQEAP